VVSPLNLQYMITTSYLFRAAVAMCLRTLLDEALETEVTRTENGELLSSIGVPLGATVVEVKTLIRMDTKK
jgi:hypothetical protein